MSSAPPSRRPSAEAAAAAKSCTASEITHPEEEAL